MTIRALVGLAGFNLALVVVGSILLWGLGAYRWLTDVVRLAGVAYLVGLGGSVAILSLALVAGVPVTGPSSVLMLLVLATAGAVAALRRGVPRLALRPEGWRFPRVSLFVAAGLAGIVLFFAGLFRQARLASTLPDWDGWWMWVPKAEAIYSFGRLDPALLAFLPNPSYPPGLPAVHAVAFHAMGSADDVTLHVQYWVYAVAFVAALLGLLGPRVRPAILVPLLFLVLLAPSFLASATRAYADLPHGYLVAIAGLLSILWLGERRPWQLACVAVLLSGAMLVKREGILFAACVLMAAGASAAATPERRTRWARLGLAGLVACALALPWRLWLVSNDLPSEAPPTGLLGPLDDLDRLRASARLAVETLVDPEIWSVAPIVALAAIVLAFVARARREAVFASVFTGLALIAATWVVFAETRLPITQDDAQNPIVRMTGTSILVLGALAPLLLDRAWSAGTARGSLVRAARGVAALGRPSLAAWAVVVAAPLAYPVSMLVGYEGQGLPGGPPRFPSAADCVADPVPEQPARVVLGYADSYPAALALESRAAGSGLPPVAVAQDGCGRLRVHLDGLYTTSVARSLRERARTAGFEATLERRA